MILLLCLGAGTLLYGLLPTMCVRYEQPQAFYPTYRNVPAENFLPSFVPPSAREIHAQREPDTGHRWVRFAFDSTDMARVTAGLRRLPPEEVDRLTPTPPALSTWWQLNPNTFSEKRSRRMPVYRAEGEDAGWLAIDPGNFVAFYWTR